MVKTGPGIREERVMSPTVWVCAACSKVGETRRTVGDESCYLHAVKVWRDSVRRKASGGVYAVTADTDWVPDMRNVP